LICHIQKLFVIIPAPSNPNEDRQPNLAIPASQLPGPSFAAPEDLSEDLSSEIVKALSKSLRERVTCQRITGNHYRCNWWTAQNTNNYDNPEMTGLTTTTHRVSRSQMLHVTKTAEGLAICPMPVI
jgi:hypothetical protein